jgi:hypothetical protein
MRIEDPKDNKGAAPSRKLWATMSILHAGHYVMSVDIL